MRICQKIINVVQILSLMNRISVHATRRGLMLVTARFTEDWSGISASFVQLYVDAGWLLYATRVTERQWTDVLENINECRLT